MAFHSFFHWPLTSGGWSGHQQNLKELLISNPWSDDQPQEAIHSLGAEFPLKMLYWKGRVGGRRWGESCYWRFSTSAFIRIGDLLDKATQIRPIQWVRSLVRYNMPFKVTCNVEVSVSGNPGLKYGLLLLLPWPCDVMLPYGVLQRGVRSREGRSEGLGVCGFGQVGF